jgi:hypothetical protein
MASEYMSRLVGDVNAQYNRTFDINSSANRGNALVLADGRSISGGSSRSRMSGRVRARGRARGRGGSSRSRASRGGFMGSVINQAVVPLALLGLQQTYRRRGTGFKGKSYKRKSRRGRRR